MIDSTDLKDIFNYVKDAWSDEELFHERLETCKGCEQYAEKVMTCKECLCWIPIKLHIKAAKCPFDKWER